MKNRHLKNRDRGNGGSSEPESPLATATRDPESRETGTQPSGMQPRIRETGPAEAPTVQRTAVPSAPDQRSTQPAAGQTQPATGQSAAGPSPSTGYQTPSSGQYQGGQTAGNQPSAQPAAAHSTAAQSAVGQSAGSPAATTTGASTSQHQSTSHQGGGQSLAGQTPLQPAGGQQGAAKSESRTESKTDAKGDAHGREEEAQRRIPIGQALPSVKIPPVEATKVKFVYALVKYVDEDGETTWGYRTSKEPNREELLGALLSQADLIREELKAEWAGEE